VFAWVCVCVCLHECACVCKGEERNTLHNTAWFYFDPTFSWKEDEARLVHAAVVKSVTCLKCFSPKISWENNHVVPNIPSVLTLVWGHRFWPLYPEILCWDKQDVFPLGMKTSSPDHTRQQMCGGAGGAGGGVEHHGKLVQGCSGHSTMSLKDMLSASVSLLACHDEWPPVTNDPGVID
jgi:hypothetical protein